MRTLLFCDVNKDFIDACKIEHAKSVDKTKWCEFKMCVGDISKVKLEDAAFLSPANSFGTMGGGIDRVFTTKMFPGVNKIVMNKINKLDTKIKQTKYYEDYNGEIAEYEDIVPYLPIGNVIATDLSMYPNYKTCYLITSPTMVEPSNVADTNNAYQSMKAALNYCLGDQRIKTLVVCGLCTGVGGMSEEESARQIFKAINEVVIPM